MRSTGQGYPARSKKEKDTHIIGCHSGYGRHNILMNTAPLWQITNLTEVEIKKELTTGG
jgi:hypothetical protein